MLKITRQSITLTKGDDASIQLIPRYKDGTAYTFASGDKGYFRLKVGSTLIEKECDVYADLNKMVISFQPEDTANLNPGIYRYEVELITIYGFHYTFIADQTFIIGKEYEQRLQSSSGSNGTPGSNLPQVDGELTEDPIVSGEIQPTNPSLDYRELSHKPTLNGHTILGDQTSEDLGIATKTSDLINDSDFVSDAAYVHTNNNYDDEAKAKVDALGTASAKNSTNTVTENSTDIVESGAVYNAIKKWAITSAETELSHSNLHGISDANQMPENSIYSIASSVTSNDIANLPVYGAGAGILLTYNVFSDKKYYATQIYVLIYVRKIYARSSYYVNGTPNYAWNRWVEISNEEHYTGNYTFASARTTVNTGYYLCSGVKYGIKVNKGFGQRINLWVGSDTSNYVSTINYDYIEFTPSTTAELKIFNADGKTGSITIDVYSGLTKEEVENKEYKYTVGVGGDYTSITACFKDLARDNFKKLIEIAGGEYDIAQEYIDNNIPICPSDVDPVANFIPYNVIVPTNSHVVGKGNVIIKYMPESTDVTYNQAYSISPVNVLGSCTLENLTIHCKNGRYCLHDDCLTLSQYNGSTHIYKNIKFIKEIRESTSDNRPLGTSHCLGFGFNPYNKYVFENCIVINKDVGGTFYGHNRGSFGDITNSVYNSPNIRHDNCVFEKAPGASWCVILDNSITGSTVTQQIETQFTNCIFNGEIHIADANDRTQGTRANVYDVTMQNCSSVSVNILDANNTYPAKTYSID